MKKLINLKYFLEISFLLLASNFTQAQNACEFDNYIKTNQEKGFKIFESQNKNIYASIISGYSMSASDPSLTLKLDLIDECGNFIWSKQIDSSINKEGNAYLIDLIPRKNGTLLYVAEYKGTNAPIVPGIRIFNIDLNGNVLWKSKFDETINTFGGLTNVLEIGPNSILLAGAKDGKAYFLIGDTLANLINQKTFFENDNNQSTIQKSYDLGNNSFALLGVNDSIAFVKYIDTIGNVLSEIIINKINTNKNISRIDFNYNKTKIILNGLTNNNNGYVAEYNLKGELIKNIVLQGLPNEIKQCSANLFVLFDANVLLTKSNKWVKLDSNYNTISNHPVGYDRVAFNDFIDLNNNFCGVGSIFLSSGFTSTTSLYLKKINLINYISSLSISGNSSINVKGATISLNINILPTNAAIRDIIWSISDTNLATLTQTGLVTAKANGTVIVTATAADGGGAKATKTITISNQNVGIEDISLKNQITVYPNPAGNFVTITTTNNLTIKQIQLLDITGNIIAQFSSQTEIDLSNISNGVYLLNIQTEKGNLVKRLVVNK